MVPQLISHCVLGTCVFPLSYGRLDKPSYNTANLWLTCMDRATVSLTNLTFPALGVHCPPRMMEPLPLCTGLSLCHYCWTILLQQRWSERDTIPRLRLLRSLHCKCSAWETSRRTCTPSKVCRVIPGVVGWSLWGGWEARQASGGMQIQPRKRLQSSSSLGDLWANP